ncbi:MAG: hypothetical protein KIH69_011235 [Anaerolineae bacterium]|nr:hypothetical protein [Anaerolineae bacterium]
MDTRQRARSAILSNAIFSVPSALVIAAGVLLVGLDVRIPVVDLPAVTWLAAVAPVWLGVVVARLFNERSNADAVAEMFREDYDVNALQTPQLKSVLNRALDYRQRIDAQVKKFPDGPMKVKLADVANQVEQWVGQIYTISKRLEHYHSDKVIQRDMVMVEQSLSELQRRRGLERNPEIAQELERTIAGRQDQLRSLRSLGTTMDRAELQLENTLTALGTVYSQALLIDARDVNSGRAQRLQENITEQVAGLQDMLSSIDEVYGSNLSQSQPQARAQESRGRR